MMTTADVSSLVLDQITRTVRHIAAVVGDPIDHDAAKVEPLGGEGITVFCRQPLINCDRLGKESSMARGTALLPSERTQKEAAVRRYVEGLLLRLKPGDKLPSRADLARKFNCAGITVSRALDPLLKASIIKRSGRLGWTVVHVAGDTAALSISDIAAEVAKRGGRYEHKIVCSSVRQPTAEDVARLGSTVVRVRAVGCLHLMDGKPYAFETRIINLAAAPQCETEHFALDPPGTWLRRNVPFTKGENRISAVAARGPVMKRLQVGKGSACLMLQRQTWHGRVPVTNVTVTYAPGMTQFVATFDGAPRTAQPT